MATVAERARTLSEPSLHQLPVVIWLRARRQLVFGGAALALLGASMLGAGFCMKGRDGGCARPGVANMAIAEGTPAAGNQRIEDSTKLAS